MGDRFSVVTRRYVTSIASPQKTLILDGSRKLKDRKELTAELFVALHQTGTRLPGSDNFQKRRRLSIMGTPIFRKVMSQAWRLGGNSEA